MGLHHLESRPFTLRAFHPFLVMLGMALLLASPARSGEHEGFDDETGRRADPFQFRPVGNGADHSLAGEPIGERPALLHHMDQGDIDSGKVGLNEIIMQGADVFNATWTTDEGAGRPLTNAFPGSRSRPLRPGVHWRKKSFTGSSWWESSSITAPRPIRRS